MATSLHNNQFLKSFLTVTVFWALVCVISFGANAQQAPGTRDPNPVYGAATISLGNTGTVVSCGSVRNQESNTRIVGGTAGLTGASGESCYSGGGQSFCTGAYQNRPYECAGLDILLGTPVVETWSPFDVEEGELEKNQEDLFYGVTTRDDNRGRAGRETALFMNKFNICRRVDNSASTIKPVFMGVSTEEEWRTVHGVPAGGNSNRQTEGGSGYNSYSNDATIPVGFQTCCSPVAVEICGTRLETDYAVVGETIEVWGGNGRGSMRCAANNTWVAVSAAGVCGEGPSDPRTGPDPSNNSGFHNPNSPPGSAVGHISADQWSSLPSQVQNVLMDQGYQPTTTMGQNVNPMSGNDYFVDGTNNSGAFAANIAAQVAAGEMTMEQAAQAIKEYNEELERLAREAAEEAAREAAEEAANDDDDNT